MLHAKIAYDFEVQGNFKCTNHFVRIVRKEINSNQHEIYFGGFILRNNW